MVNHQNIQTQHIFLVLIYVSLRIRRFKYFLQDTAVQIKQYPGNSLIALDDQHHTHCGSLIVTCDKPGKLCVTFKK